ncbi:hypothetical protein [Wolbachia endosymbiont (group A) of Lasioglossum fulvicorne]
MNRLLVLSSTLLAQPSISFNKLIRFAGEKFSLVLLKIVSINIFCNSFF